MRLITPVLLFISLAVASCTRVYIPSSPTAPTVVDNSSQYTQHDNIEFRVTGNAQTVRVKYDNSLDGLTQLTTTLPYVVTAQTTKNNIFLSLEVTPIGFGNYTVSPFLSAQIFINGVLFREATSNDFLLNTLVASGTFRR